MNNISFENVVLIDSNKVNNFFNKLIINNLGISKNVEVFSNCLLAINFIENNGSNNLIFLNLNAPCKVNLNSACMSGWEFLEKLKRLSIIKKTKVVIMHNKALLPEEEIKLYEYSFVDLVMNNHLEEKEISKIFS